ncbi:MAG: hypothetical protein LUG89_02730 [Methanosphaera sp.]|nr:hypothetical protein [Methanosphaera sp.]
MLYKYHVVLIKDDNIITDKYYKKDNKPDNTEYKNLVDKYDADQLILNTIQDDKLNTIDKEEIDIEEL